MAEMRVGLLLSVLTLLRPVLDMSMLEKHESFGLGETYASPWL